jgi:hypothetical protein
MARTHRLVTIQDNTLQGMAQDPRFVAALPFLGGLKNAKKGSNCSKCGSSNKYKTEVFQSAKRAIATLGAERKNKLKELLDTDRVRLVYRSHQGKFVELTF